MRSTGHHRLRSEVTQAGEDRERRADVRVRSCSRGTQASRARGMEMGLTGAAHTGLPQ